MRPNVRRRRETAAVHDNERVRPLPSLCLDAPLAPSARARGLVRLGDWLKERMRKVARPERFELPTLRFEA